MLWDKDEARLRAGKANHTSSMCFVGGGTGVFELFSAVRDYIEDEKSRKGTWCVVCLDFLEKTLMALWTGTNPETATYIPSAVARLVDLLERVCQRLLTVIHLRKNTCLTFVEVATIKLR